MPQTENATAILVDFDRHSDRLRLRSIGASPYVRFDLKLSLKSKDLEEACASYWRFVDRAISSGKLTLDGSSGLTEFYDDLITAGVRLCKTIFNKDDEARRRVWALARQSTVITLITDLMDIPWEGLFDSDSKSFLSDNCVIVRWPEDTRRGERIPMEVTFERDRIVCLDPVIAADERLRVNGIPVRHFLESHFGQDLVLTTRKRELVESARNARLVQWICEHAEEGLRVSDTVFYSCDDCAAHPFSNGSILVLTSCKSGASNGASTSVASDICVESSCTVIAPSSVVATAFGANFARIIDTIISQQPSGLTVVELWRNILVSHDRIVENSANLTAESCFARWYGIYGNGQAAIK
jgi:hypothetical protein